MKDPVRIAHKHPHLSRFSTGGVAAKRGAITFQKRDELCVLEELFRELRRERKIVVPRAEQRQPDVATEAEIRRYYETIWQTQNMADLVLIKTLSRTFNSPYFRLSCTRTAFPSGRGSCPGPTMFTSACRANIS